MTALVEQHTPPMAAEVTSPTLATVLDAMGVDVVRVLTAPLGMDVAAGELIVHDPVGRPTADRHDLVLAVGVDPTRRSAVDVVTRYGELGVCAVLLRTDGPLPLALVEAAKDTGVALLAAPGDAAWGQLHTLLRTARSTSNQLRAAGAPLGDLFGLADAVSSLLGGAVTVEDQHSVVMAYSSTGNPVDEPRRDTILGRRVPPEWLARLHEMGIFRRLWGSDDVVRVELDGIRNRLAIAVRAGGEVLGSIWVQEGSRPLGTEAEQALREAASIAALHLLRARSGEDFERRRAGDQLLRVLEGRLPVTLLSEPLQLRPEGSLVVLALELVEGSEQDATVVADRAVNLVLLSCRAFRRPVVAVASGRTVYAVLPGGTGGASEARKVAEDLSQRVSTGLRVPVRSCVTNEPHGLSALIAARGEVDLGLRVLASRAAAEQVHVDDIRSASVLLQLRDVAAERPALLSGKVRLLQTSDRERSTSYVATLRAFLDGFGDVRVAADLVGVHPNTFRYRLRRLTELAELDLTDPVERLVVQLQLHLLET